MIYVFGNCELDTGQYVLRRAGRTIALSPKVFQVLSYLLAHHDRVISKQELCEQVWPNQFISDAALESTMRVVRQTLGDSGRTQQFIQTRRGHGYRIVVAVTVLQDSETETALPPPTSQWRAKAKAFRWHSTPSWTCRLRLWATPSTK